MWQDRVSNPGPLTYESGALPTGLRGLATGKLNQGVRIFCQNLGLPWQFSDPVGRISLFKTN